MKKLIISLIGMILFFVVLFSALDDFVFVVDETNQYLTNIQNDAQNTTIVVDYSSKLLTHLMYGMVISAITAAFVSVIVGVIKRF